MRRLTQERGLLPDVVYERKEKLVTAQATERLLNSGTTRHTIYFLCQKPH